MIYFNHLLIAIILNYNNNIVYTLLYKFKFKLPTPKFNILSAKTKAMSLI